MVYLVPGGVLSSGGCTWSQGGIPGPRGVSALGGVCSRGVSALGGAPGARGCAPEGGLLQRGVVCWSGTPLTPVNRMNDRHV